MKAKIKHDLFVAEYIANGLNATKAATVAGYSEDTAAAQASRLLKNVNIKKAIEERLKQIESAKIANANEVLQFLSAVVRGQVKEVVVTDQGSYEVIKVSDRVKAAQHLAKYWGLQVDKVQLLEPPTIVIDLE